MIEVHESSAKRRPTIRDYCFYLKSKVYGAFSIFKVYHIVSSLITRDHAEGVGGRFSCRSVKDRSSRVESEAQADEQELLFIVRFHS